MTRAKVSHLMTESPGAPGRFKLNAEDPQVFLPTDQGPWWPLPATLLPLLLLLCAGEGAAARSSMSCLCPGGQSPSDSVPVREDCPDLNPGPGGSGNVISAQFPVAAPHRSALGAGRPCVGVLGPKGTQWGRSVGCHGGDTGQIRLSPAPPVPESLQSLREKLEAKFTCRNLSSGPGVMPVGLRHSLCHFGERQAVGTRS